MMIDNDTLVKNRLKAPKRFFEAAKEKFPVYIWESTNERRISSLRSKYSTVVEKKLRKNTRFDFYSAVDNFVWVGVTKKRIEFQTFKVYQYVRDGKEDFEFKLFNFEQYTIDGVRKMHLSNGHYIDGLACTSLFRGPYSDCYFYSNKFKDYRHYGLTNELAEQFQKFEGLKYIDLEALSKNYEIDFFIMLSYLLKYRDRIEYAQKIKARGMLKSIIGKLVWGYSYRSRYHQHTNMGRLTMSFLRRNKAALRDTDITFEQFKLQEEVKANLGVCVDGFVESFFYNVPIHDKESVEYILSCIPDSVKPIRFQNWVVKHKVCAREYMDYQNMLKKLGIAFYGDRIVLPKDFKAAHDEAIENYNAAKESIAQNDYVESRLHELLKLETTIDHYSFVVPKDLSEIKEEGKALHHCVGSYTSRHAKGETSIIFVRDDKQVDTPLYTLEMHKGHIIQFRAAHNNAPSDEAKKASEQFLAYANKKGVAY